jgi:hypothetical protein
MKAKPAKTRRRDLFADRSTANRAVLFGPTECQRGGSFPTLQLYSTETVFSGPVKLTHIRVTLPSTLFHERTPFLAIGRLWGSRRKVGADDLSEVPVSD